MTTFATSSSISRAEEHDAILEQAREDVPAALAAVGLLDDGRDERAHVISAESCRRRFSGCDSQATSAARENRQTAPSLRPGSLPASASSITTVSSICRNWPACSAFMTSGGVVGLERVRAQRRTAVAGLARDLAGRQRSSAPRPRGLSGSTYFVTSPATRSFLRIPERLRGAIELVDRRRGEPDEQRALDWWCLPGHARKISQNILPSTARYRQRASQEGGPPDDHGRVVYAPPPCPTIPVVPAACAAPPGSTPRGARASCTAAG